MKKNSKKLFLNNTAIETRRTTSKTAGGGLANYAIELGQWIENRIKDNTIKVGEQHVVDDIATRDDLFDVTKGDVAYVVDASADANVGSGAALYVYDGSDWKRIAKFESLNVTSSNITEGTLNPATTDRTVDLGGNTLDIIGTNNKTIKNTTGSIDTNLSVTNFSASISQRDTGVLRAITAATSGIFIDNNGDTYINLLNSGELNLFSSTSNYRIGGLTGQPLLYDESQSPKVLYLNPDGYLKHGLTSAFFISDSDLSPAISGKPTLIEVRTYIDTLPSSTKRSLSNRVIYYTGNDNYFTNTTHAYYMTGNDFLFEMGNSEISNITEGTLNPATTNRIVDMGSFDLSIERMGINKLTLSDSIFELNHNATLEAGNIVDNNNYNRLKTTPTYAALQSRDASDNCEISVNNAGQVMLYSLDRIYRIGSDNTSIPPVFSSSTAPYMLSLNANNGIMYGLTSSSYFISDSSLSPASSGAPTFTEVETYVNGLGAAVIASLKNRVLYYTGTDTSTDAYIYSYYFSGDAKLFVLDKPEEPKIEHFSLTVTSGSASISSADNGITSNLLYLAGYNNNSVLSNFVVVWDHNNSTAGSFTAQLKDNNGNVISTLNPPDNTFSGSFSTNVTTTVFNVRKGLYVEFSNITGTVKSPAWYFALTPA
jgi:hypothetical protein